MTKTNEYIHSSLAYAELYKTLARVFCQFDMELEDTTAKNVAIEKIYFTGYPRLASSRTKGGAEVKVKVTHKLEA